LPENWPIYPGPHSSPPLYLVIRGWPHDGGLPTRFRTEPINSYMNHEVDSSVRIINNNLIDAFHDRELVLLGMEFLETKLLNYYGNSNFTFVKDL